MNHIDFTTRQVADFCNISQPTVIRLFDDGRIKGYRLPGSRHRRIPPLRMIEFMREEGIPLGDLAGGALIVSDNDTLALQLEGIIQGDVATRTNSVDAGMFLGSTLVRVVVLDMAMLEADIMLPHLYQMKDISTIAIKTASSNGDVSAYSERTFPFGTDASTIAQAANEFVADE